MRCPLTGIDAAPQEACDDGDGLGGAGGSSEGGLDGGQCLGVDHLGILEVVGRCHADGECVVLICSNALGAQEARKDTSG